MSNIEPNIQQQTPHLRRGRILLGYGLTRYLLAAGKVSKMSKKMLINASHPEENRVAIVVDGLLSELDIEIAGQEQTKGNIYKAVVVRVESGLQAAFVDYGAEKLGFLQIGEIHPSLYPSKDDSRGRPRITDILQRGQEILVQIVKEERGNKGAALTTNLSVPGRYMVLMPDSTTKGVSRKIQDDPERKKLKRTMAELDLPERMGYIVRTAGIGKEKEELRRDFDYLVRLFEGIVARKDQVKAPAQLYQESNLVIRSIRDYFSSEMDEVLIDDQKVYQETKDFFALVMPELSHLVKQHRERRPVFSRYQIEEQIDALAKNQIPMPSGGSIVIDQTEALVSIDVNSGKMSSESGIEATASKTNLEAAAEVGRQLRLRDLGGLVVIDFIDMRDRKHIREVEQELRKALKDDKAKVTVGRISQFGLMEMSRQRLKPTLSVGSYLECPHCLGKGRIKSAENQAVSLLRQIHAAASKGHIGHIEASVPINVANDLHNNKRQSLVDLERRLNLKITIIGRSDMLPGQLDIELLKRESNGSSSRESAPVSHANQIENALAAAQQEDVDEPTETAVESVDPTDSNSPADAEPSEAEGSERKTRRRRRRRRRNNDRPAPVNPDQAGQQTSGEATTLETNGPAAVEVPAQTDTSLAASEAKVSDADQKPAKPSPRRRRTRRPAAQKSAETNSAPEETNSVPGESASEPANSAAAEQNSVARAEQPAPHNKDTQKTATAATTETATAGNPSSGEEKPKRRSRRTKPAGKTASTGANSAPADAAPTETPTGQTPPTEAPQAAVKSSVEPATSNSEPAVTEEKEKPKPKPRARRTTKKVAESTEAAAPNTVAETGPGEEKPKPKPRARKTTKKVVAKESTESAPAATDSSASEEKPKPKPRRTTKKPAATSAAKTKAAASDAATPATAAKTSKAKAADTKTETTTTAGEEKPKRRPGRPRKTVKPVETDTNQDS